MEVRPRPNKWILSHSSNEKCTCTSRSETFRNIHFENRSEFDWDGSDAIPHAVHVHHKSNSEKQTLSGLWLALLSLVASKRKNHRQQSAKWHEAKQQRGLQILILYKIIIGSSVTFRFTSIHQELSNAWNVIRTFVALCVRTNVCIGITSDKNGCHGAAVDGVGIPISIFTTNREI